jgi:predicted nucleotidyltransferase
MDDGLRQLIERAAKALKAAGAREVYYFGSAAKKTSIGPSSDIDIAVSGLPPEVFFKAMSDAEDAAGHPLDLVDLDDDTPFTRHLKEEGELQRVG